MKTIIAGSRGFNDLDRLDFCLYQVPWEITEVVSGTARGADSLGEYWAEQNGIPIKQFPADWNKWGKRAGYIRNIEMAKYADACIIFWDGDSKGSKHMMDLAVLNELYTKVFVYEDI